jgi:hypothetical protein
MQSCGRGTPPPSRRDPGHRSHEEGSRGRKGACLRKVICRPDPSASLCALCDVNAEKRPLFCCSSAGFRQTVASTVTSFGRRRYVARHRPVGIRRDKVTATPLYRPRPASDLIPTVPAIRSPTSFRPAEQSRCGTVAYRRQAKDTLIIRFEKRSIFGILVESAGRSRKHI